jgi:hypothetical protein
MQKNTESELVAMIRTDNLDLRDRAYALLARADANELAHDALIAECGYGADALMYKGYCVDCA